MIKVGITGGIGSGKSTVCGLFAMLGIPVYYADNEARKLYDTDKELKAQIIKHFGEELYKSGAFDKEKMKGIVFNHKEKLQLLNSLVHPIVRLRSAEWYSRQKTPYAIKEAALLIESKAYSQLDRIIFVECPMALRIERVRQRDHLTTAEIQQRMNAQMPDEQKKTYAHHIILNDDYHLLIPQVLKLHEMLMCQA
jgi:dephospho-CoA kinase